jgi:hypothetical protein
VKRVVFVAVASLALAGPGMSQQPPPRAREASASTTRKHVLVNGKPLPASQIMVKDGVSYVDASALAEALGASVQSEESRLLIRTDQPTCSCDKTAAAGQRFSDVFRSDVAGVPDEIESLRAVVMKKEKVPLGPRFDAIDRKLTLSTVHVQTDADMAVYYALSYANNSLAIAYYKESRGVPADEAQKNQVDSLMCSMESKFALMKGTLLPGGTCSVLKRMESQLTPKPAETSD